MPDFSKIKKGKKELKVVNEEKIYQTEKDPNNFSGCVISWFCKHCMTYTVKFTIFELHI